MSLNLKKIYKKRYSDRKWREAMWKILVRDFFQRFIDKNDVVLEAACGYGEFINNIQAHKKLAVDINSGCRQYIKGKTEFICSSASNLKTVESGSLDKIFVSNFFEHVSRQEIVKTIGEFKRVLKKGGQILVLQPNIRFLANNYWMFFDHITALDDRSLSEAFEAEDFHLKKKIIRFLPYTTESYLPHWPILVKIYLKLPFLWRLIGKQSFLIFEKKYRCPRI